MRLIFIALSVLLAGCAAAIQVGPAAPDPNPTIIGVGVDPGAEIVVYRANSAGFIGNVAATPALTLDGRSVGTCRIGQPLLLRLPAGTHRIEAITQNGQVTQDVSVQDGETRYLRCGTATAPTLSPRPSLQPVDTATATRELNL